MKLVFQKSHSTKYYAQRRVVRIHKHTNSKEVSARYLPVKYFNLLFRMRLVRIMSNNLPLALHSIIFYNSGHNTLVSF